MHLKITKITKIPKKKDLDIWIKWLNNKKTSIYSNRQFKKHTIISQKKFLKKKINSTNSILFKVSINGAFIGVVEISEIDFNHNHCEIGFMIGDIKYNNKGYATHAVKLLIQFSKKKKFRSIYGRCYSKNNASIKVFKKNKFSQVANIKKYYQFKNTNKKDDMLIFSKKLS